MKASELQPGQFPQGTEARVCEDIAERQSLGVSKYGTTVERNPLCLLEWLEHAYQECLDQAVYLKRAIEELQTGKNVTGWDDEPPVAKPEQNRPAIADAIESAAAAFHQKIKEPEQFSAGDWVVWKDTAPSGDPGSAEYVGLQRGKAYKVQRADSEFVYLSSDDYDNHYHLRFRRATPAEIAEQQRKDYWQHPVVEPELTWTVTT